MFKVKSILRIKGLFVSFVVIFVMVSLLSFVPLAAEKTYILKLADTTAPIGLRGIGLKILIEEIEKHSEGRIKVEAYWGGSLLKGKEILKGVQDGVVQTGFVLPEYYTKEMPVHSIFSVIPQGPTEFNIAYKLYFDIFDQIPEFTEELESYNQKLFYLNMQLPVTIVCTKPFKSFEDFKGKRIRASSGWYLGMLDGAGAIATPVPWGDLYMALSTGTIEGVYANLDGEHRTKLDEVAPNVFTMKEIWMGTPLMYNINLDFWNKLPSDLQDALMAAGKAASERFADLHANEWERCISEQKEMGCTITKATKEDIQKWVTMPKIDELQEKWIKEVKGRGVENAEEIMDKVKELVQQALKK